MIQRRGHVKVTATTASSYPLSSSSSSSLVKIIVWIAGFSLLFLQSNKCHSAFPFPGIDAFVPPTTSIATPARRNNPQQKQQQQQQQQQSQHASSLIRQNSFLSLRKEGNGVAFVARKNNYNSKSNSNNIKFKFLPMSAFPLASTSSSSSYPSSTTDDDFNEEERNTSSSSTVLTLTVPPREDPKTQTKTQQQVITLIGTAHLSEKSNQQVQQLIEEIQPNVVMIELDPSRLGRIGISDMNQIQNLTVVATGETIEIPKNDDENQESSFSLKNMLLNTVRDAVVNAFSNIARVLLTGMYKDLSKEMNTNNTTTTEQSNDKRNAKQGSSGGGEFLVAIRSAEACPKTTRLVLGDRSSITTIRRAATLAWQSGDPIGVLNRLQESNAQEMQQLEARVKKELQQQKGTTEIDRGELQIAVMETLKEDSQFRDRLFQKLEQQVPEFTQAFLKERDYIMSESIRRELEDPTVERIVGVVGLAHVPGMEAQLKQMLGIK